MPITEEERQIIAEISVEICEEEGTLEQVATRQWICAVTEIWWGWGYKDSDLFRFLYPIRHDL